MAPRELITFRLDGADELERMLGELPKTFSKAVLRNAAKKALRPVRARAKANAQSNVGVVTGEFSKSFRVGTTLTPRQKSAERSSGKRSDISVYVGSTDPKAHLIEFGTSKMDARPVLRPAWDEEREATLRRFAENCAVELAKASRRLNKRASKGTLSRRSVRELLE